MMKRLLALIITIFALSACSAESQDRESNAGADRVTDVDTAEVFRNIDNFPNIERVCIQGVAFAATRSSTDSNDRLDSNLIRVPEWDNKCPGNR
jgi:PBP1b-binding outer membrane lipoprotein LpoB